MKSLIKVERNARIANNFNYYSVSKINVRLARHVDFGDKNALLDQNFGFTWST